MQYPFYIKPLFVLTFMEKSHTIIKIYLKCRKSVGVMI